MKNNNVLYIKMLEINECKKKKKVKNIYENYLWFMFLTITILYYI